MDASGTTLAYHPAGHRLVEYRLDGQIYTAVYHKEGFVEPHPRGGWGVRDFHGRFNGQLPERDLVELRELVPDMDMPVVLPSQLPIFTPIRQTYHPEENCVDSDCPLHGTHERPSIFVDWDEFWAAERDDDVWLYQPILAKHRGHAIFASHKVGKSLVTLYIALQLVTSSEPIVVIYLDYEMTRDDLEERLLDMGLDATSDLSRLRYALIPALPPLDSPQGSEAILGIVDQEQAAWPDHHILVVVDTTARAVVGEENSADTIRNFYRYTGSGLKRRGVTWLRLDHAGKDADRGQRGSSAKGDDVDIVWKVAQADKGLKFTRQASRITNTPEIINLERHDHPLRFTVAEGLWPAGTAEKANLLDRLGAPADLSVRIARGILNTANEKCATDVLAAAVKYRKQRLPTLQSVPSERDGTPER